MSQDTYQAATCGLDLASGPDLTVISLSDGSAHARFPRRGERTVYHTWNPRAWTRLETINWRKAKRLARKGWADILDVGGFAK